ncbi:MAG: hypothetical protein HFH82_00105 [Lachnospiraceae bacterium]|nr:hypothetical protein [Lachnospiraceae bacterium]
MIEMTSENFHNRRPGCAMAVRKEYVEAVSHLYCDSRWSHDNFFWKIGSVDGVLALLTTSTSLYRIHAENASRNKRNCENAVRELELQRTILEMLEKYIAENKTKILHAEEKYQVIHHKLSGIQYRIKFFESRNPYYFCKVVLGYRDGYPHMRQAAGDFLLAYHLIRKTKV